MQEIPTPKTPNFSINSEDFATLLHEQNESYHFPKIVNRVKQYKQNEKEVTEMCEIMERERQKGIEIGKRQGVEIGKQIGICNTIELLLDLLPVDDISPRIKSKYALSDEQAQSYIQMVLQKKS